MSRRLRKYPTSIIPKSKYKLRLSIDDLLQFYDLIIIRRIDEKPQRNNLGTLRPIGLYTNDIPDMSTNMLGADFVTDFVKFKTRKAASQEWKGHKIDIRFFADDSYEIKENYNVIYIPIKPLHKIIVPYVSPFNKDAVKNNPKFTFERKKVDNTDVFEAKAIGEIKHLPTNFNYWHVVLEVKDISINVPIDDAKNQLQKSICNTFIDNIISKVSKSELPSDIDKIDKIHYYQ